MANRYPHRLPGNKSSEAPSACIWVDTETRDDVQPNGDKRQLLWFGWACYRRRRGPGKWSAPEWHRFETRESFWSWCLGKARNRTRLYVFAHNGAFDLPVLGAFSELPKRGWQMTKAIVDAPPMDITWKSGSMTLRFVDTLNYWRLPLDTIGDSVGLRKLTMPSRDAPQHRWDAYGRRDVKVIMRAVIRWVDFLQAHDLGGFKGTLASQAFTAYRHRFMPVPIMIHDDPRALALERASYVGGRTECFRLGILEGEYFYVDVNSMYPGVMRKRPYPCSLQSVHREPALDTLHRWAIERGVIADVIVETDKPLFPLVDDGTLIFPVGRFRVTLAGPELKLALDRGLVRRCFLAAVYNMAELFTDYIDTLYHERMKARLAGDLTSYWLFKIMMNSLYGKFGQRGRIWRDVGIEHPDTIELYTEINGHTNQVTHRRTFGGIIQEWQDEGEAFHSFPAIASYITSHARLVLLQAIEAAGWDQVLYCDTDSLVMTRTGFDRIQHLCDPARIGAWAVEAALTRLELHGPKDYVFDETRRVKGIRQSASWLPHDRALQDRFVGFKGLLRRKSLDAPIVAKVVKKQHRQYRKGTVDAEGRVSPFRLGLQRRR